MFLLYLISFFNNSLVYFCFNILTFLLSDDFNLLFSFNIFSFSFVLKPSKIFKKVSHKVSMLSPSNAFCEEDLINFEKRIINFLDQKSSFEIEYSAEPKIDGISASLIYKKGKFIKITKAGFYESMVHSVEAIKEETNYKL